jgi:hypothetical protein
VTGSAPCQAAGHALLKDLLTGGNITRGRLTSGFLGRGRVTATGNN